MKLTKTFIEDLRKAISADLHADDCYRFFAANEIALVLDQNEVSRKDIKTLVKAMNYLGIPSIILNCYVHLGATEEDLVDWDILA